MFAEDLNKVLGVLLMRFDLTPYSAIPAAEAQLARRTDKTWKDLAEYLIEGKVICEGGELIDKSVQQQQQKKHQSSYRGRLI